MKILKSLIVIGITGVLLCTSCGGQKPTQNKQLNTIKLENKKLIEQIESVINETIKNKEAQIKAVEETKQGIEKEIEKQVKKATGNDIDGQGSVDDFLINLEKEKHSYIMEQIRQWEKDRQHAKEMQRIALRIDIYYTHRGSPMQGTGIYFAQNWERTGINPYLSVAISEAESTCGRRCYNNPPGGCSYNAWGMLAYPNGFGSWEEGISANFDWLQRYFDCPQTAYNCPGYCEPSQPWMDNVDAVRTYIQNINVDNLLNTTINSTKTNVVVTACMQLGEPYVYGSAGPDSFDCSGLVEYCYESCGVPIPRTADVQGACGTPVPLEQLEPGDLVGFRSWNHIGIYIGDGVFIHAPQTGDVVKTEALTSRTDFCGVVRPNY